MKHQNQNEISYSRGSEKHDNEPIQYIAHDFLSFVDSIKNDVSKTKGLAYVCAPMSYGVHDDPLKYPDDGHWRLASHALKRRFIAFDFDGFASPDIFEKTLEYFERFSAFIYTTASSTDLAPRARAVVEIDREVDRAEGKTLCLSIQNEMELLLGVDLIKFDETVYRAEQPIYTPVIGTKTWITEGHAVDVDYYLSQTNRSSNKLLNEDLTAHLTGFNSPETPVLPGSRNSTLLSYAGHLRSKGLKENEILALVQVANKDWLSSPLDDSEVVDICKRYANRSNDAASVFVGDGTFGELSGDISIPSTCPPRRRYIFADRVTPGTLCTLGGSGGASKTMLMMQIAVAMACGIRLGEVQVTEGSSLLLLGEEDDAERDRRFGGICEHMGADHQLVRSRVKCFAASGVDMRLTHKVDGNPEATWVGREIIKIAQQHAEVSGAPVQLIVVDHARLVLGGDPNAADDVTQLTRVLTSIAKETGAAVVLIAHSPKSVLSKDGEEINAADIAGSSAFVDNSRAAFMSYGMRKDEAKTHHVSEEDRSSYVRLAAVKANYAVSGGGYWFKRSVMPNWEVAVLEPVTLHTPAPFQKKSVTALRERLLNEIRNKQGGITMRNLRDKSGTNGVFKASEAAVRKEIIAMLDVGLIDQRKPTADERKLLRLPSTVKTVLVAN